MSITIYAGSYQWAHGKNPRGTGSWAFFPNSQQRINDAFWVHGASYGDAKRQAVAHAKAAGWREVHVGA